MTPEGYEEAGRAGAEFNPTKREKNSQSHKPTKLKPTPLGEQDNNGRPLKGIEARLPEPQYRTVAGHVSRRANTSAAADPPPPPPVPSRATSSDQQRRRRKKADGGGFGDDSDDSDSDDRRPGQGKDSPSVTGRRSPPRVQNDREPSSASASSRPFGSFQFKPMEFNKEERERLGRRRELGIISSIWENTMQLRSENLEQAAKRKALLIDHVWGRGYYKAPGANRLKMQYQGLDEKLDKYLEHSLHRAAIEAITHNVHPVMQSTYRFIRKLELEVTRLCEDVNHAQHAESPSHLQRETRNKTLLHMAALMSKSLRVESTDLNIDTWSGAVNTFAEALMDKMMRCAERGRDYLNYPLVETLPANASGDERTRFFLFNPKRYEMRNDYMEWLCEDVDIDSIRDCSMELLNGLRAMQRLKTLREGTQQIFMCRNEDFHGTSCLRVSLVMFKGNQPLRTQRVSPSELSDIGWVLDRYTPSFWRYSSLESIVAGEQETRMALFKVDMHGAVLAIQGSDGQWVDWESLGVGE